jgi:hypothetical protein
MTTMQRLEKIAWLKLGMVTLKTRNSDDLDFRNVSVWGVRAALAAAYKAGFEAGKKAGQP